MVLYVGISGHFKSMLDLASDNTSQPHDSSNMPEMDYSHNEAPHTGIPHMESDVRIVINDVTVDSTDDFSAQESGNENEGNELDFVKKTIRRSSWCPEEVKKNEERREKARMLAVQGRR